MDGAPMTESPLKDLYEVGEIPPLGHVPQQMYAWAIRRERQGEPEQAMQLEVVDVPKPDSHEVLVLVMAAGVNYNGVWASLGIPISDVQRPQAALSHRRARTLRASSGPWATRSPAGKWATRS